MAGQQELIEKLTARVAHLEEVCRRTPRLPALRAARPQHSPGPAVRSTLD